MLWLTIVTPPLIKAPQENVEIWGGVGVTGGEDDVEKVGRTSGKKPGYAPAKARKNNRSLEKRPYHLSGVALSRKRWTRIIRDEIKKSDNSGKRSFFEM